MVLEMQARQIKSQRLQYLWQMTANTVVGVPAIILADPATTMANATAVAPRN